MPGCGADHHSPNEDGQMTELGQNTDNLRMVSPKLLPKMLKKLVEPMWVEPTTSRVRF